MFLAPTTMIRQLQLKPVMCLWFACFKLFKVELLCSLSCWTTIQGQKILKYAAIAKKAQMMGTIQSQLACCFVTASMWLVHDAKYYRSAMQQGCQNLIVDYSPRMALDLIHLKTTLLMSFPSLAMLNTPLYTCTASCTEQNGHLSWLRCYYMLLRASPTCQGKVTPILLRVKKPPITKSLG